VKTRTGLAVAVIAVAAVALSVGWFALRARHQPSDSPLSQAPGGSAPGAVPGGSASDGTAPVNASGPAATPSDGRALAARLLLYAGAPGDETFGVIRIYDARMRNGLSTTGATVLLSRAAIESTLRPETQGAAGTLPGPAVTIVQSPGETPVHFTAATTEEIWITIRDLRPADPLRVSMTIGGATITTNWTEPPAPATSRVEGLAARARVQSIRALPALLDTGDQLVAAAPNDWRGHYYRGLALETRGDVSGAVAALQNALERVKEGSEPPLAITERLARLRQR